LGLTLLLRVNDPVPVAHIGLIANVWCTVLTEIREDDIPEYHPRTRLLPSGLVFTPDEVVESHLDDRDTPGGTKQQREIEILKRDPVHVISLPELIRDSVLVVQRNVGGPERFRELCQLRVDEVLLEQMNTLLS
jgi:hypothetical protein